LVFNLIEWSGKELSVALKVLNILKNSGTPFTGSGPNGYEISSNKTLMKQAFEKFKIPSPNYVILKTGNEEIPSNLNYPAIMKPLMQHCGLGVSQDSLANTEDELRAKSKKLIREFDEPALVEEFIDGRELHVTVLEKDGQPWVLPPCEIVFSKEKGFIPVLSYAAKWEEDSIEYSKSWAQLAELENSILKKVTHIAKECFVNMDGHDYPRLDFRLRGDDLYLLEINNNPGIDFSDESGFGVSGKAAGFTYEEILTHIVENAYLRFNSPAYDSITA
jgi:D-alanine-D-alanine ligase